MSTVTAVGSDEYRCSGGVLLGMCIGVSLYWLFALSMGALLPSIAATMGVPATGPNLGLASSMAGLVAGICIVPAGGLAAQGGGLGFFATPATGAAINAAPTDKAGVAGGIFKMASSLGGAFGIAIHLAIYGAVATSTNGNLHTAALYSIGAGIFTPLLAALVALILAPSIKKQAA